MQNDYNTQEQQIATWEEIEQFLCYIGLRDELYDIFISKGINSLEKLLCLQDFNISKIVLNSYKKNLIIKNAKKVFDKIREIYSKEINNEDEYYTKPTFLEIIRSIYYELEEDDLKLSSEILLNGFKMKNKPGNCLPNFKQADVTPTKIYASFLNDKKITHLCHQPEFINLKHLYLNNNKIQILEQLHFPNLNILELSNNLIRKIENLENLKFLTSLNLEKNMISRLENIQYNVNLETLNLSKQSLTKYQIFDIDQETIFPDNIITTLLLNNSSLADPSPLNLFKNLKKIKLNNNKIYDFTLLLEGLKNSEFLDYLTVANNPFTENNKNYRDLLVIRCKGMTELDDKTITDNEKRYVNSFYARKFLPKPIKKANTFESVDNLENSNTMNNKFSRQTKKLMTHQKIVYKTQPKINKQLSLNINKLEIQEIENEKRFPQTKSGLFSVNKEI
jgi:hypothetical protein